MAHSHESRRKMRKTWAKQNDQVGLQRKECHNRLGINQFTTQAVETLEGIMQQLDADESVTIFDVALVQRVQEETASRLLNSLEKAGIVQSEWEKFNRVSHGQPMTHARKRYRLTAAYYKGLAVFEPRRLVGIEKVRA